MLRNLWMQWTMRALDQKKEEAAGGMQRRLSNEGSPKRCSPKRVSPKRRFNDNNNSSPPRNRHLFCNENTDSPQKRRERCHWCRFLILWNDIQQSTCLRMVGCYYGPSSWNCFICQSGKEEYEVMSRKLSSQNTKKVLWVFVGNGNFGMS